MEPEEPNSIADPAERLVVEILGLPEDEQARALEDALARHPELAEAVRARWAALQALGFSTAPPREFPDELGDYRLIERLGGGGMGVVFRAEQRSLGREVALKLLRPDQLYFPGAHERFRREVEAIASLQHPGIVPVYAVGEDEGIPFFSMERITGATLADVIEELGRIAPERLTGRDLAAALEARSGLACPVEGLFAKSWVEVCTEIGRQVGEALHHAHERGILHRDVKPSNVALTCDGRAMLLDFGLASSSGVTRLTESGSQVGTLLYMAPEQVRGEARLDARVDVYGLGITLVELLTLQAPFQETTRLAVETRILDGTRDPLRARNRRVSPELELVCAKATDVDPARRYASAAALADDLRRIQAHEPVRARPIGPLLRARRWMQREPVKAIGIVAAVGLFGVAPGVLYWREVRHASTLDDSLTQEREAREEAQEAFLFLERLLAKADPARAMASNFTVRDALELGVEELESLADRPRLQAKLLLSLGETFNTLGLFERALPLLERAAAAEDELGEALADVRGHPHESIAFALVALNRLAEAEGVLQGVLAQRPGEYRGRVLYRLANIALRRDEPAVAAPLLVEARAEYAVRDDDEGKEGWIAISSLLASALGDQGEFARALEVAEACHAAAVDFHPAGHPAIADALDAVANARFELGDEEGALADLEDALAALSSLYGDEGIATVRVAANYGTLLVRAGQLEDGYAVLEGAYEVYLSAKGPRDPTTVWLRESLDVLATRLDGGR